MTTITTPHPPIVSQEQWLGERKKLLADEKALTKHYDRVNAERRRLPMVKIEKNYVFDGPHGKPSLKDLFEGRRQLIVYHFMFDPTWDKFRCPGCTGYVDALGDLSHGNGGRPLNPNYCDPPRIGGAMMSKAGSRRTKQAALGRINSGGSNSSLSVFRVPLLPHRRRRIRGHDLTDD